MQGIDAAEYAVHQSIVRDNLEVAGLLTGPDAAGSPPGSPARGGSPRGGGGSPRGGGREEIDDDEEAKRKAAAVDAAARATLDFTEAHSITPHFSEVSQLLAVFSDLQESDLFLVQNAQVSEAETEAVRQKLKIAIEEKNERSGSNSDSTSLSDAIKASKRRLAAAVANEADGRSAAVTKEERNQLLTNLHGHVKSTFAGCGMQAAGASTSTVEMLRELEGEFEMLNTAVASMVLSGDRGEWSGSVCIDVCVCVAKAYTLAWWRFTGLYTLSPTLLTPFPFCLREHNRLCRSSNKIGR